MTGTTGAPTDDGQAYNIYSDGYITTNHSFQTGPAMVTVTALGEPADGGWPHMIVRVGSTVIGDVVVSSGSFADYAFSYDASAGVQEIQIEFSYPCAREFQMVLEPGAP